MPKIQRPFIDRVAPERVPKEPEHGNYRYQLFIDHVTKKRWGVKWWDAMDGNHHRKRRGSVQSSRFETEKLRAEFVASGFEDGPNAVTNTPRRNAGDREYEQSLEPETWPEEWNEVLIELSMMRARLNRLPRQYDVYAVMKKLGFTRSKGNGGH